MIEQRQGMPEGMLEFRIHGPVTEADYREVLIPALDAAIEASERVRVLIVLESGVSDFTLGAMIDDARLGLKHWRGFDRMAVVTARTGIKTAILAFSVLIPCPVMTFEPERLDEARRWLRESLGTIHQTDLGGGVLMIQLAGQLDSAVYAEATERLNAFIRGHERFRLLIDLREFDGWQGLGALGEHLKLARDHVRLVDRAAIVGNAGWQRLAEAAGRTILGIDARYFPGEQFEAAKAWLTTD